MTSKRKLRQSLAVIMAFVLVATLFIPYAAFADEFQLKGSNQGALSSAVVGGEKESDLSAATNNDDVGDVDEQNHSAEPSTSQSVVEEDRAAKDSSSHTESTTTQEQELAEVELLSDEAYEVGSEGDLAAALAAILDGTAENKPVKLTQGFAVTQSIVVHNTLEDAAHVLIMADQPVTLTANAGVRHFDIQGGSHDFSLLFHNIVLDGGNVGGGLYVGASDAAPVFINGLSEGQADPYGGIYTYELTLKNCSAHDGGSLFLENSNVSMFNTTILNSKATAKGGGIYCDAASHMNLSNIVVSNSSAAQGGGLYVASLANPDAPIAIERSTFNDNTAASDGGGIYAQCSLSLAGSSFANNTAQDNGGAITMTAIEDNAIARLAMSDTLVAGNSALGGSGGGIFASADTTELRLTEGSENPQRMKIFGNSAAKDGGGLFIAGEDAMFYIHGALIESNTAGDNGGGVSVRTARSSVELMDQGANGEDVDYSVRPTVTGNSAGLNGGGMYFGKPLVASEFSGYVSMYAQDAVISHNKAGVNGGGIGLECDNNYTHFYQGPENGAMPIEISKNSAGNSGGGVYLKGEEGSTFYASGIILSDNAALGQQGSATGDGGGVYCWGQMHTMVSLNSWRTDSPSLVTGNTAAGSGGGVYAFSTQASTYVDAQSTDIVDNSAAGDGGGVYIKGNYYGSIRLSGGYDYETGDQTFRSLARNTAGGSGGGVYAEGNFSNVMAERIEIDANRAAVDGGGICYVPQGAIDLWSGDPIHWNTNPLFMGVMFTENQAGGSGGGLYVGDNNDQDMGSISLMFEDSQFNENAAGNGSGGALYVGDNIEALYFQPSAEGNSSSFTNNNAAVDGGGAYIGDNLQNASINTVEFSGNKAQGNGGAVRIGHSSELLPETLLVEQSLFEKNSAAQHGGAVWIPYDSLDRLKVDSEEESDKTIFTGNTASRELESVLKKFPEDITRHDEKIFTTMFSEKPADYDYGVSGRASNPFSYAYNNFDISYKAAYMVFYDGNGNTAGEAPTDVVKYLPGETTVVQGSGSLVKDGYTFGGWALSAEGTEAVTSPLTLDDHDVTLYAIWTKDSVVDPGGPAVPIDSGSAGKPIDVGSKLIQTGDFDMVPIAIIAGIVVLAATAAVVARRFAKAQGVNEENTK